MQLVLIIFLQKLPRLPVLALQNIKASSHRCQKCFLSSMQLAIVNTDGTCHYLKEATGEEKTWLDNYEILQYYRMFDQ